MYYQNYEDYIKSILGYPISQDNNSCQTNTYTYPNYSYNNYNQNIPRYSNEILNLYPEIYKLVNPMVCKICEANSQPITAELVEQMTDEIYANLEWDNEEEEAINVRVTLPKEKASDNVKKESSRENRNTNINNSNVNSRVLQNNVDKALKKQEEKSINASQNRQNRRNTNSTLRDLIKILILNQLLGGNRPNRPPMPRPPYPGRPIPNPYNNINF